MLALFVLQLFSHSSNAWVLETSDTLLYANMATNLTLHCYYDNKDHGQSRMKEVLLMSINKVDNTGSLVNIAHVDRNHYQSNVEFQSAEISTITAIGHAENVGNSYLSVTWSDAFPTALGKYSCTINGIGADEVSVTVTTDQVVLAETQGVAKELLARTRALEKEYKEMEKRILDQTEEELDWPEDEAHHHVCCRRDGNHNKPIALPVKKPFYLYRYGGKCQQVKNAVVSQEWITVHTGFGRQKDHFSNSYHNDATLNPYHSYFCYYEQQE